MILLAGINSKYIHSNPSVYYLRDYANERIPDADIRISEYTINQNTEEILADIYRRKPDVLAVSCYIWNRETVDKILGDIPKILPECHVILGGPEAAYDAESMLKSYPFVEAVMLGEGEETFTELCRYYLSIKNEWNNESLRDNENLQNNENLRNNESLRKIPGLCLHNTKYVDVSNGRGNESEDGKSPYIFTAPRPLLSMDDLPFFYKEWADEEGLGPFKNKILYYETSRGCPFNCSYCLSSIDKKVRFRSLEKVYEELQFFIDKKVPQVKFVDRTFNCNVKHASAIWQYLVDHDNGITNFHFEISADILTESEIEIMSKMRPGLIQLEIGVQTTNPQTMEAIHRTAKLEKIRKNVASVKKLGNIHQHLDLIAGLPYEDLESFKNSFNDVFAMEPDQLQLGFLKVLKGADIAVTAMEYEIQSYSRPPFEVISTGWLSYGDIIQLKKIEEVVEIFYNSGQFTKTLPYLVRESADAYSFFEELAGYFDEMGYFLNHPARVYRYVVLLEFASRRHPEKRDFYAELLTCDIYLRENMKSRPEFARDLQPYKDEIIARSRSKRDRIEVFYYDMFGQEMVRFDEPQYVWFDYDNRDPLSNNAEIKKME